MTKLLDVPSVRSASGPGDGETQVKGAAQEIRGKVQNAWGDAKEAVKDETNKAEVRHEEKKEIERERKEDVA